MSLTVDIEKRLGSFTLSARFETDNGIMALLGASGCGKSVTLKCVAGIMTPDKGRIILDGKTLFDSEKHINLTPQQRRIGYLFQQYALFPNMTVAQNIMCGVRSGNKDKRKNSVSEHIRRFRLQGLEKKYPSQISGGQQQRVALARILASEPRVILLDEPFSALDSFLKWNLELELSDWLADFNGPIIWVSHDLRECYRNCQTVCIMENGISGPITSMNALAYHPSTQGAARLAGCHNFLPAVRCEGGIKLSGWNILLSLNAKADNVTVAVPDNAVNLQNGQYKAIVERVIRDIGFTVVLLRPETESSSFCLRVTVASNIDIEVGQTVDFNLLSEKCLCYE